MSEFCDCCGLRITERQKKLEKKLDDHSICMCNITRQIIGLEDEIKFLKRKKR